MNYFIDVAASAQRDLADAFDYIDLTLKIPLLPTSWLPSHGRNSVLSTPSHSVFHL